MRPAPLVFVPDLVTLVLQYLEQNQRYRYTHSIHYLGNQYIAVHHLLSRVERLTWYAGVVPQDEVWVKVGGDKGGSSFKMSFQLVNTPNPNSIENTCVFTVFEAKDSTTNLQVALEKYTPQITQLQSTVWQ